LAAFRLKRADDGKDSADDKMAKSMAGILASLKVGNGDGAVCLKNFLSYPPACVEGMPGLQGSAFDTEHRDHGTEANVEPEKAQTILETVLPVSSI
jgi:hypothetical protein